MKKREDWSMREWRDYYDKLAKRAEYNYQCSGEPRYDREWHRYDTIVSAFNGYLENKNEVDDARVRRQYNIDAYAEQHIYKDNYTRAEVMEIIRKIREF